MKINYIVIPLIVVLVSLVGSQFTSRGTGEMSGIPSWYSSINLPLWTPPGSIIGVVWTIIFILGAISALIFWNRLPRGNNFWLIVSVFLVNAILNIFWSYLFFVQHLIGWAALEAGILGLSVLVLIILIWRTSKTSSFLLLPYFLWTCFATYLTYCVWLLN